MSITQKKSRKEELKEEERIRREKEREAAQNAARRSRRRVILFAVISVVLVAAIVGGTIGITKYVNDKNDPDNWVVMATDHFKVTYPMFLYYLENEIDQRAAFLKAREKHAEYPYAPDKPLYEQKYDAERTYLDYFEDLTRDEMRRFLRYAEEGYINGYTFLSPGHEQNVFNEIVKIQNTAKSNGVTTREELNEYIKEKYGDLVSVESISKALNLYFHSIQWRDIVEDRHPNYDSELLLEYAESEFDMPMNFYAVELFTEEESRAVSIAESMAAISDPDEFYDAVEKYYSKIYGTGPTGKPIVESKMGGIYHSGWIKTNLNKNEDIKNWAFTYERESGDGKYFQGGLTNPNAEYTYTVVHIVTPAYEKTRNVGMSFMRFYEGGSDSEMNGDERAAYVYDLMSQIDVSERLAAFSGYGLKNIENIDYNIKHHCFIKYDIDFGDNLDAASVAAIEKWYYESTRRSGDMITVSGASGAYLFYYIAPGTMIWEEEVFNATGSRLREDYRIEYEKNMSVQRLKKDNFDKYKVKVKK